MAPFEILLGEREQALSPAHWWSKESARRYTDARILALFYSVPGETDQAFGWLEKGLEQRSPSMTYVAFDVNFPEAMRADPRFQAVLRRMRLLH
jgi:hypothetical protein